MAFVPSPHNRSQQNREDEDDLVDKMVSRTGCADQHYAVQECMAEQQDWRKCQTEVHSFKLCMSAFQKARKENVSKQTLANTS